MSTSVLRQVPVPTCLFGARAVKPVVTKKHGIGARGEEPGSETESPNSNQIVLLGISQMAWAPLDLLIFICSVGRKVLRTVL